MKPKIKEYVDHYFRFDKREDLAHLKAEIIANLSDRFDALVEEGLDEKEAYIEALKTMGDFNCPTYNQIPDEFKYVPEWPEYALPASAILGIFAVLLIFLNSVVGGVATAVSIILYAIGGYYLYAKAMEVKSEELDIERHTMYLTKIFKYMKTTFVFWSFNISFLVASIIQAIASFIIAAMQFDLTPDYEDIINLFTSFFLTSIISFVVTFVVMMFVFNFIYKKLMFKYYVLTGSKQLKGKIQDSYDFMDTSAMPKTLDVSLLFTLIFGALFLIIFMFVHVEIKIAETHHFNYIFEASGPLIYTYARLLFFRPLPAILFFLGVGLVIAAHVMYMCKKLSKHLLPLPYLAFFVLFILSAVSFNTPLYYINFGSSGYSPLLTFVPAVYALIYYLVLVVYTLMNRNKGN